MKRAIGVKEGKLEEKLGEVVEWEVISKSLLEQHTQKQKPSATPCMDQHRERRRDPFPFLGSLSKKNEFPCLLFLLLPWSSIFCHKPMETEKREGQSKEGVIRPFIAKGRKLNNVIVFFKRLKKDFLTYETQAKSQKLCPYDYKMVHFWDSFAV